MEGCNGGGEIDIMCEVSRLNIQLYNYALFMPFGTLFWGGSPDVICSLRPPGTHILPYDFSAIPITPGCIFHATLRILSDPPN